MSEQVNRKSGKGELVLEERAAFQFEMAKVSFVAGTQAAYLRAFDAFAKRLDRKTPRREPPSELVSELSSFFSRRTRRSALRARQGANRQQRVVRMIAQPAAIRRIFGRGSVSRTRKRTASASTGVGSLAIRIRPRVCPSAMTDQAPLRLLASNR